MLRGARCRPLGIEPKRRTMVQLRVARSGLKDLPLVDAADGTFYFKGESDHSVWLSPHDEIPSDPCDAAPEEMDIAIAIDRFEKVVDWPIERVERSWAGLEELRSRPVTRLRIRPSRAGVLLVRGAGRLRDPDVSGSGDCGGAVAGRGPTEFVNHVDPVVYSPARFS